MKVYEIREQRAARVAEMRGLLNTAETEKRELNAAEKTRFDELKAEIVKLEAQEQRAAFLEQAERGAAPIDKSAAKMEARISLLDAIAAQVENRALTGALAEFNQEQARQGIQARGVLVPASLFEQRTANDTSTAGNTSFGPGIVPDDFRADQFVGLLRNSTIVRSLGARTLSGLRGGNVVIPRQTSTTAAEWLLEGDSLNDADPLTFDNIMMTPRHVGALTELSRQLIQQSNPSIEALVRDDFVRTIGLAVDRALLHGDGVKEPIGLLDVATGSGDLSFLDWESVLKVIEGLGLNHIIPNYWLTTPQVATLLRSTLKSPTAGSTYLMEGGQMADVPVAVTQQLDNVLDSHDEIVTGRVVLGDFSELLIGTWGAVDVLANPYGTAYARGGVQIRILTTMDAAVRRPEAFAVIDDVDVNVSSSI